MQFLPVHGEQFEKAVFPEFVGIRRMGFSLG